QRGAEAARRVFGVERDQVGEQAAEADAGDEAQVEKLPERSGPAGEQGERAEDQAGADDGDLAAVAVADVPEQGRADEDAEQARAEDRAELGAVGDAPGFD